MSKLCMQLTGALLVGVFAVFLATGYFFRSPANDRNWAGDQGRLASSDIQGDTVTIHDVRNFTYTGKETFIPAYYDKAYNLNELVTLDYIVEKFSGIGAAHTFLSFGFADGSYVAISAEIRKEVGEKFSPVLGLLRSYELMYVIADERDVITLRANFRHDPVYVYPTKATPAESRALFVSMLERANTLRVTPEFYNTLTNTCTTNIARHINQIVPGKIPWDLRLWLPSNSDVLAYELGLLGTSVPLTDLRTTHQVNTLVKKYADDPHFSQRIRGK